MDNLKTYLCRNCKHEGTPLKNEPCHSCSYYNLEAMSPIEFVYEHLVEIFDNNDCYDRRLKAYELLNLALSKSDGNPVSDTESKCNKQHIVSVPKGTVCPICNVTELVDGNCKTCTDELCKPFRQNKP